MNCELCGREIMAGDESKHHLIPKSNGGAYSPTAILHSVCHKQIHALFDNKRLSEQYNTMTKLKMHKDIKRFIKWVQKKPINFNPKMRISRKKR